MSLHGPCATHPCSFSHSGFLVGFALAVSHQVTYMDCVRGHASIQIQEQVWMRQQARMSIDRAALQEPPARQGRGPPLGLRGLGRASREVCHRCPVALALCFHRRWRPPRTGGQKSAASAPGSPAAGRAASWAHGAHTSLAKAEA